VKSFTCLPGENGTMNFSANHHGISALQNVTGSLPNGNILAPFTALGITVKGKRMVTCLFRVNSTAFLAAEMSRGLWCCSSHLLR